MQLTFMIGNLTKTPEEVRGLQKPLCKFAIAVNENYTTSTGEKPVNYFNIVVWGAMAENCVKYLDKGSRVAIIGRLQNRKYVASDGSTKYITEIIASEVEFLSKANNTQQNEDFPKIEDLELADDEDFPF